MNGGILNASLSSPAIVVAFVLATSAHATTNVVIEGKCVSVHDGDTITVLTDDKRQVKVRLAGIDAPEEKQAFGERAKLALSSNVFGKAMSVLVTDADRYGRSVGDIRVDGVWINLKMVADGWAWHYRRYSQSEELADAERDARRMRLGLWADKEPTPPWEFRSGKTESRR